MKYLALTALFLINPVIADDTNWFPLLTVKPTQYGPATTYQSLGNTTFDTRGNYWQNLGNTTYDSQGGIWQSYGNTTFGPNGKICQTIGNTTYCN